MRTRLARSDDLVSLLALYQHFHPDDPGPTQDVAAKRWREMLEHPGLRVFVALTPEDTIASTCTLSVIPNLARSAAPYGVIENVVTWAPLRAQGYGGAVLRRAIEEAWSSGCYKVMLMTGSTRKETLQFYERAGFDTDATGFQIRRQR